MCLICKDQRMNHDFEAVDRNRRVDNQVFEIVRCPRCGMGCTMPKLPSDQLGRYYPDAYYSLDESILMEASKASRLFRQDRMNRIQQYVSSGRLIDIGSGTGMFLKTAREHGFDVQGMELSKNAAAFGNATWGLDIRQENLHDSVFPPNRYDVVTVWHVFEHLHDPLAAIRQFYNMVRPGGMLVIAVPNFMSIQARLFRARWFHLDVPRHLFHHTPESIRMMTEAVGFKVIDINFFSREHNWAGILGSIMRLNPPNENFVHKTVRKLIGMPLARALAFLEAMAGRGGTIELYAKK